MIVAAGEDGEEGCWVGRGGEGMGGVQKLTDVDDRIRERRLPLLAPENRGEQQNPHNFHVVQEMLFSSRFQIKHINTRTHKHANTHTSVSQSEPDSPTTKNKK